MGSSSTYLAENLCASSALFPFFGDSEAETRFESHWSTADRYLRNGRDVTLTLFLRNARKLGGTVPH